MEWLTFRLFNIIEYTNAVSLLSLNLPQKMQTPHYCSRIASDIQNDATLCCRAIWITSSLFINCCTSTNGWFVGWWVGLGRMDGLLAKRYPTSGFFLLYLPLLAPLFKLFKKSLSTTRRDGDNNHPLRHRETFYVTATCSRPPPPPPQFPGHPFGALNKCDSN